MQSVRKALWFIEGRFGGEVSHDELSEVDPDFGTGG